MDLNRQEVHQEDTDQRDLIHDQDYLQIDEIKKALDIHIALQKDNDKVTADKLDKLMPLTDLIQPIKDVVNERQAMTIMGKKYVKWLGVIGAIAGIIWAIIAVWKSIDAK